MQIDAKGTEKERTVPFSVPRILEASVPASFLSYFESSVPASFLKKRNAFRNAFLWTAFLQFFAKLDILISFRFQIRPYFYPTIDVSACTEVSRRVALSVYGDEKMGVAFLKVFFTIMCEARFKDKLAYLYKDFANGE